MIPPLALRLSKDSNAFRKDSGLADGRHSKITRDGTLSKNSTLGGRISTVSVFGTTKSTDYFECDHSSHRRLHSIRPNIARCVAPPALSPQHQRQHIKSSQSWAIRSNQRVTTYDGAEGLMWCAESCKWDPVPKPSEDMDNLSMYETQQRWKELGAAKSYMRPWRQEMQIKQSKRKQDDNTDAHPFHNALLQKSPKQSKSIVVLPIEAEEEEESDEDPELASNLDLVSMGPPWQAEKHRMLLALHHGY